MPMIPRCRARPAPADRASRPGADRDGARRGRRLRFLRARACQKPGDLELVLGLAESLEAEGDALGLESCSARRWRAARIGWPAMRRSPECARKPAKGRRSPTIIARSLEQRPDDRALHHSYWQSLARAERYGEALAALRDARRRLGDDPALLAWRRCSPGEVGRSGRGACADRPARRRGPSRPHVGARPRRVARGRCGRGRKGVRAHRRARSRRDRRLGPSRSRLAPDRRSTAIDWLTGAARPLRGERPRPRRGLARPAGGSAAQPASDPRPSGRPVAARRHADARAALLARSEPEIGQLREAIAAAVADHFRGLPPKDDAHPLLKHRDSPFGIDGSWSVRLSSQGFHVNHIHPEGILSSACYISLAAVARLGRRAGTAGSSSAGRRSSSAWTSSRSPRSSRGPGGWRCFPAICSTAPARSATASG